MVTASDVAIIIAELEKIEVTDEDIDGEIKRIAEAYNMEADQVKGVVPVDSIAADMKVKKAMDLVKDNAIAE